MAEEDIEVVGENFEGLLRNAGRTFTPFNAELEATYDGARSRLWRLDDFRVLDAVHSASPDLGSYIVCEYATGQSLEVILSQGPLSGLEAAWVVREVADALAGVHSLGLYHQRINPDTVIITPNGNIKIVGLLIEAALRPVGSTVVNGADTPELVAFGTLLTMLLVLVIAWSMTSCGLLTRT